MKTILFFYYDVLLKRSVCEAYTTLPSNVNDVIEWKRKCLQRGIKEGYLTSLIIQIIDKLDFTMHQC